MAAGKASGGIGLTGTYLHKVLRKKLKLRLFEDVYSADKVPAPLLNGEGPRLCIVNCSTALEPGSHFITLLIRSKGILVLDSLALSLSKASPTLHRHLLKSGKEIEYAFDTPLQSLTSAFCGIYCMYFCTYISESQFPKGRKHLLPFDAEAGFASSANDRTVLHNFKMLINKNRVSYIRASFISIS